MLPELLMSKATANEALGSQLWCAEEPLHPMSSSIASCAFACIRYDGHVSAIRIDIKLPNARILFLSWFVCFSDVRIVICSYEFDSNNEFMQMSTSPSAVSVR